MQTTLYIGYAYLALEEYEKAAKWCEQGMSKPEISLDLSVLGCDCLAQAYSKLGQTKKTLTYYEKLTVLKDSLHKEELSIQVNNLETQEQYEKELAEMKQQQAIEKEQDPILLSEFARIERILTIKFDEEILAL